jgi:hypothetical protein
LLHEHLTLSIEKENGERTVERCILGVDAVFIRVSDGAPVLVE